MRDSRLPGFRFKFGSTPGAFHEQVYNADSSDIEAGSALILDVANVSAGGKIYVATTTVQGHALAYGIAATTIPADAARPGYACRFGPCEAATSNNAGNIAAGDALGTSAKGAGFCGKVSAGGILAVAIDAQTTDSTLATASTHTTVFVTAMFGFATSESGGRIFIADTGGMAAGDIGYVSDYDATTGLAKIKKAKADAIATAGDLYVTPRAITAGEQGVAVKNLVLAQGVNLAGATDGDPVFLSDTVAGQIDLTEPTATDYVVRVGTVIDKATDTIHYDLGGEAVPTHDHADNAGGSQLSVPTATSDGLSDGGGVEVGYVYQDGVAADTETVTIGGRVYEFDTNASTTGDVAVDINADQTADAAITALVAAINGDASATVEALAWTGNDDTSAGCTLVAVAGADATDITLANAGTNTEISAANFTGGAAVAAAMLTSGSYTVTAQDVTSLALGGGNEVVIGAVASTTEPTLVSFLVRSATGGWVVPVATVLINFKQVNSNFWALVVDDGAASLTATDVITWAAVL